MPTPAAEPKTVDPNPVLQVNLDKQPAHRIELSVEFLVEVLIFVYPFGAEQMDLPHNFWIGLISWVVGVGIAIRILWIFPWTASLSQHWKLGISTTLASALVLVSWNPVIRAYQRKRSEQAQGAPKSAFLVFQKPSEAVVIPPNSTALISPGSSVF